MENRNTNNCCVDGCRNKQKDSKFSFFALPKDSERRNEWLQKIGRPDLANKSDLKPNSYKVCSLHFDSSVISEVLTRKLLPSAAPTRFLTKQAQASTSKCENECTISDVSTQTNNSFLNILSVKNASTKNDDSQTLKSEKEVQTAQAQDRQRKRKLLAKLQTSEQKRRKLEYELAKFKKETKINSVNDTKEITKRFNKLLQWQNIVKNKYKGNHNDREFKFFALNLHFSSPQCYRSLQSLLKLPNESTLSRFKLNVRPELDDRILNTISKKIESLPDSAKYCTVCIGEMVLKRHLYYDIRKDEIIGLHNINGNVTKEVASNAYVILLRGIFVNWKQPIGYALLASAKHYQELDDWMNEMLSKLFTFGIKTKAIVSDLGSNFDKYAKEVKQVTAEKPYFILNGNRIYYIFDVPHMLNSIRNNLLTNDFYIDDNKISWEHIQTLYSHQKEQNLRIIPKITDAHIEPNNFQKMRVKYAAQIFSRSVYGALNTFIYAKLLPEEARATAEFVKSINDLFDVLNSKSVQGNNKYQQVLTLNTDQIKLLDSAQNMLRKITAINRTTGVNNTNNINTFKNLEITIEAMKMLCKDVKNEGFKFVLTRRLNQDPLEKIFGALRQQAVNCQEPTPIQFMRAFSKLFLCNMLKNIPAKNCQDDFCDLLLKGDNALREATVSKYLSTPKTLIVVSLDGEVDYRFDLPTENAFTYVSGYFLFKCSQRHQCPVFTNYSKNTPLLNDSPMFDHFKAFNKKSSFYGSLRVPPENFTNYIKKLETTFLNNFDGFVIKMPANRLLSLLKNIKLTAPCPCFPKLYLLKLFVRFRIFATLKFNNKYFRDSRKYIKHYIKVKQL